MTVEVILFMIVGSITIITAALMLMSDNAVHSALFLIINFMGVAFLYLMLEAPFLAMVQIAVYAGAIMVLFLFVIMLLGAEKTGAGAHLRRFRWMAPVAIGLAVIFIISVGWALTSGKIDTQAPPAVDAQVRFVHAAALPAAVSAASEPVVSDLPTDRVFVLLVNGEVADESFAYGDVSDMLSVTSGAAVISLREAADGADLVTTTLELASNSVQTVVLAGDEAISFYAVPQSDVSGLTVFNAYAPLPAVALGDLKGELSLERRVLPVGADDVPFGTYTEPLVYPADFPNWIVFLPGGLDVTRPVVAGETPATVEVASDQDLLNNVVLRVSKFLPELRYGDNTLIILSAERLPDGSTRPLATRFDPVVVEGFGSPIRVGRTLFTDYLLPFQLVALLLLASMVGVIVITYRGDHVPKPSRETRRKVARPLTSVITSQTGTDLNDSAPQLPEHAEQPAGD